MGKVELRLYFESLVKRLLYVRLGVAYDMQPLGDGVDLQYAEIARKNRQIFKNNYSTHTLKNSPRGGEIGIDAIGEDIAKLTADNKIVRKVVTIARWA